MVAEEPEPLRGEALAEQPAEHDETGEAARTATASTDERAIRDARPAGRDSVAEVMQANLRRSLLGIDAPAPKRGRFTVLERIGSGAMGTVLSAYDPVLDRKVALKVLRERGRAARARMLAEARALARLSHPHVVGVHEADEHGDEVYIAMEYVQGVDLRTWLAERSPSWTEVVSMLTSAARGLAAAHAAGVIHCDFKPDNVLVTDGGAKVVDFGLAFHRGERDETDERHSGGTPAYMAPERLAGAAASGASDQFAFAVTLFEALHGHRPGEAGPEVPARSMPRWLERLLERMLDPDPSKRLPSMDAVVVELSRPRRTRRAVLGAGVVLAVTAVTGWIAYRTGSGRDPCDGGAAAVDAVWSESRAEALEAALHASGVPYGASTSERVVERLDEYRARWSTTHREVCEATRVHGTQSDTRYDLRMRCLERGLRELSARLEVIEMIDAGASARAIEAIYALAWPDECGTVDHTAARYALPDDGRLREQVEGARGRVDRAWAAFATGRYDRARTLSAALVEEAERLEFTPLHAEVLELEGAVVGRVGEPREAEAVLRRALRVAARTEDERLAASIAVRLLRTMMFGPEPERVHDVADFVRAAIERAGADVHEVDGIVGEVLLGAGDAPAAIEALSLALSTEGRPDRVAILQTTLASANLATGQQQAAVRLYAQALERARGFYGPDHPSLGFFLQRLGRGQREAGQLEQASQTLGRALAVRRAALGDADRAVASTLLDLGMTQAALGDAASAVRSLERALEIREAVYGPEHARVAEVLLPLGDALRDVGESASAESRYRRALEIRRRSTPQHPQVGVLEERLGNAE